MKIEGEAKRVRVYIGESDQWRGKPLFTAIVERCRREGLAGATVLRGIEGFGAHSRIHTARILQLSEDLPLVIEIVIVFDLVMGVLLMGVFTFRIRDTFEHLDVSKLRRLRG